MIDLSGEFQKFYRTCVVLPEKEQAKLRDKEKKNIKRLKSGLTAYNTEYGTEYKIRKTVRQGSMAMHTTVQNDQRDYDIDVAVVFDRDNLDDLGPLQARRMLADAIRLKSGKFLHPPECKTGCVRVYYEEGYHLDLPVFRRSDRGLSGEKLYEYARLNWSERENVPRKDTSFYEYRMKVPNRFLKDFLRRFRRKADREDVENLSREFKEEMVEPGFLLFHKIRYRYLGCMLEFHYSEHFQCYELLLADVVNLEILPEQLVEMERLEKSRSMSGCRFFREEEIERRGVTTGKENLKELITNHSWKILEKFEDKMEHGDRALEKVYEVPV